MDRKNTENKLGAAVETKEAPVDPVLNCPKAWDHAKILGQVCSGCATVVPGGGMYQADVVQRFFPGARIVEQPPHPFAMTQEEKDLWVEYERVDETRRNAMYEIDDLRRGRAGIKGTRTIDGNVVYDDNAPAKGMQTEAKIGAAQERLRQIEDHERRILLEIQRLGAIRGAKHRAAILAESFPPPGPGLVQRIGEALRGPR